MEDFDAHIAQMERDLGDFEKCRPFILTTMLETCLLLNPGIALVDNLVNSLLAARRPYGDVLLWPEKAEPTRVPPPHQWRIRRGRYGYWSACRHSGLPTRCKRPWTGPCHG